MLIDVKNKKILFEIWKNARKTSSEIGRNVGLSREVVDYRLRKLKERGIIERFITLFDTERLGYYSYDLHIMLQDFTLAKLNTIIDYLNNHPYVKWVAQCSGKWDLIVTMAVTDRRHLDLLIGNLSKDIGQYLRDIDILPRVRLIKDAEIPMMDEGMDFNKKEGKKDFPDIDSKDLDIFEILSYDARTTVVQIGQKVGLTPEAVAYRIRKWNNDGLIKSYRSALNVEELGYLWLMVMADVKVIDKEKEKSVQGFFKSHKNIFYVDKIIGKWNYRIQILAKDHKEFYKVLVDIRNRLSDLLKAYELVIIFNHTKQISLPKGAIDELRKKLAG